MLLPLTGSGTAVAADAGGLNRRINELEHKLMSQEQRPGIRDYAVCQFRR